MSSARAPKRCNVVVDVELTEASRNQLQGHYPQGIVREYDVDKPFKLRSITTRAIKFLNSE